MGGTTTLLVGLVSLAALAWTLARPWRPFWLLILVAVAYPRTLEQFFPVGNSSTNALHYLAWLLAVVGIVRCRIAGPINVRDFAPLLLVFVPVLPALLNFAFDRSEGFEAEKPLITLGLVMAYVMTLRRNHPDAMDRTLAAIPALGVVVTALAAAQYAAASWGPYETPGANAAGFEGRAAASFGHPTIFGIFTAFALVTCLERRTRFWPLLLLANAGGVLLSGSRTAVVAALVGAAVVVLTTTTFRALTPIETARACFISLPFIPLLGLFSSEILAAISNINEERFVDATDSTSFTVHALRRDVGWNYVTDGFPTFVVGHGPRAAVGYLSNNTLLDSQAVTFDNTYLTMWIDYGLLTLLALAVVIVLIVTKNRITIGSVAVLLVSLYAFDIQDWLVVLILLGIAFGVAAVDPKTIVDPALAQAKEPSKYARQFATAAALAARETAARKRRRMVAR